MAPSAVDRDASAPDAAAAIRQITPISPGALLVETMYEVTHYRFLLPGVQPTSEGVLRTLMKYVAVNRGCGWQFLAAQNTAVLPGYPPADPPR